MDDRTDNLTIMGQHRADAIEYMDSLSPLSVAKSFALILIKTVPPILEKDDMELAEDVKSVLKSKQFILSMKRIVEEHGTEGLINELEELDFENNPDHVIEFLFGGTIDEFNELVEEDKALEELEENDNRENADTEDDEADDADSDAEGDMKALSVSMR